MAPFTVIASEGLYDVKGIQVRGRKYAWGIAEVDNASHCNFVNLRELLLQSHMEEFKDVTNDILYEAYRTEKLSKNQSAEETSEEQIRLKQAQLKYGADKGSSEDIH